MTKRCSKTAQACSEKELLATQWESRIITRITMYLRVDLLVLVHDRCVTLPSSSAHVT